MVRFLGPPAGVRGGCLSKWQARRGRFTLHQLHLRRRTTAGNKRTCSPSGPAVLGQNTSMPNCLPSLHHCLPLCKQSPHSLPGSLTLSPVSGLSCPLPMPLADMLFSPCPWPRQHMTSRQHQVRRAKMNGREVGSGAGGFMAQPTHYPLLLCPHQPWKVAQQPHKIF